MKDIKDIKIIKQMFMDNLFTIAGFLEISQITNKKVINNFKLKRNIKMTSAFTSNTLTLVITIKERPMAKINNFRKSIHQLKAKEFMMRIRKKFWKIKKKTSISRLKFVSLKDHRALTGFENHPKLCCQICQHFSASH